MTEKVIAPPIPWRTRLQLRLLSLVTDCSRRTDGTLNRRLFNMFNIRFPPRTAGGVSSSDVTVDPSRNLWIRIYTPTRTDTGDAGAKLPLVVFFHGGGFVFLGPDAFAYDAVCRRLARRIPAVVASVNYRLAPEHKFPSQYEDGFDALAFLAEHFRGRDDVDLSRCFLAGDSAGANLAHHVAVRYCREKPALGGARVEGLIAIQPFFGGEERTEAEKRLTAAPVVNLERADWMWKAFLPEGADRDHAAVNVSGPNAEDISKVEGFPRTAVVVGGLDPLQDWGRRYQRWLVSSGKDAVLHEYPEACHAFYVFPEFPDSLRLILLIKDFINGSS